MSVPNKVWCMSWKLETCCNMMRIPHFPGALRSNRVLQWRKTKRRLLKNQAKRKEQERQERWKNWCNGSTNYPQTKFFGSHLLVWRIQGPGVQTAPGCRLFNQHHHLLTFSGLVWPRLHSSMKSLKIKVCWTPWRTYIFLLATSCSLSYLGRTSLGRQLQFENCEPCECVWACAEFSSLIFS